jgi:hypothetical protein
MVQPVDGGAARLLMTSAADGRVMPSGQLIFLRLGTLMAVPFDASRASVKGDPIAVVSGVMQSGLRGRLGAESTQAGMFAVSSLGALAFIRGPLVGAADNPLIWTATNGQSISAEPTKGAPSGGRLWTRITPDRTRAVVGVQAPTRREVWLIDWTRDTWTVCPGCSEMIAGSGVWSPDGRRLALSRKDTLVAHALDGSAPDEMLVREENRTIVPSRWLPDGRIVYESSTDLAKWEIKVYDAGSRTSRTVVPLGVGSEPDVSPDGRWLAYTWSESGEDLVVAQAFPGPGSRVQISAGMGSNAAWSADGKTLFYLTRAVPGGTTGVVMAVDIATATLTPGKPRELFRRPESQRCGILRCYDVSPDGPRFLLRDRTGVKRETVSRMDLVLNWTATLPAQR